MITSALGNLLLNLSISMATLNTNQSIVDYLTSRGLKPATGEKFPLYDTRSQLYGQSGLGTNLGEYRGSSEQNTALLNYLSQAEKKVGVNITPENIFSIIGASGANAVQSPTGGETTNEPVGGTTGDVVTPPKDTTDTTGDTTDTMPGYLKTLASQAAGAGTPSAEDLSKMALEQFTESTGYKFAQEEATSAKETLQLKAQRDTQDFIRDIASRGLFFSGQTKEGISAIEVDKMADLLGVDRDFAKIVAEGLQKSSQEIVKQAKKGSEDAVSALDKLGFVVAGDRIVQKPSEARAEATAERADVSTQLSIMAADRAERQMEATQARFEESQAATQARFEETQARLLAKESGAMTPEDIAQVSAYTAYVEAGVDQSGKEFGLSNVPEKYRGNVAVQTLANHAASMQPRDLTDEDFRALARNAQSEGYTYAQAIADVNADPRIQNKERAALVIGEIYGVKKPSTNPVLKPATTEVPTQLKALWQIITKGK